MRQADYGPVPVSRIKDEAGAIFTALEHGRRVLISRRSKIVAAIDPPGGQHMFDLALYAVAGEHPQRGLAELTATEINQGSPSNFVLRAMEGRPAYVTRGDHVYGFLRPVSASELAAEAPTLRNLAEADEAVLDFVRQNPDATATDAARERASHLADLANQQDDENEQDAHQSEARDLLVSSESSSLEATRALLATVLSSFEDVEADSIVVSAESASAVHHAVARVLYEARTGTSPYGVAQRARENADA